MRSSSSVWWMNIRSTDFIWQIENVRAGTFRCILHRLSGDFISVTRWSCNQRSGLISDLVEFSGTRENRLVGGEGGGTLCQIFANPDKTGAPRVPRHPGENFSPPFPFPDAFNLPKCPCLQITFLIWYVVNSLKTPVMLETQHWYRVFLVTGAPPHHPLKVLSSEKLIQARCIFGKSCWAQV